MRFISRIRTARVFLNHQPYFARDTRYWPVFISICASEEMISARFINPVVNVTVYSYNGTSRGFFSAVGTAKMAAIYRVMANLPDRFQGGVPKKILR